MLAMGMGCGKSRIAIEQIHRLNARMVLIFAPLSVVDHVWRDQINEHRRGPIQVVCLGNKYKGTKLKIRAADTAISGNSRNYPLVFVVNYEACVSPQFRAWAKKQKWDLIILDESHKIKGHDGKISNYIASLTASARWKIALTGTPMPHSPMDIYAQYRALDPRIFGNSYHRFQDKYAEIEKVEIPDIRNPTRTTKIERITGFKNEDELHKKFRTIAFQVRTDDVLDLPATHMTYPRIEMAKEARRIYNNLEEEFIAELESGGIVAPRNALSKLLRLQQVTSGYAVTMDGATERLENAKGRALEETIENIGDEPVVVFARFIEDLRTIADAAKKKGRNCWEHSGQVKELDRWQAEGGVIAMQIQAGGTGLDLTKARYCIYYSLGFSLGEYEQSMARLNRPGQERQVTYIHLLAADTVDERVMGSLRKKERVIESILRTRTVRGYG